MSLDLAVVATIAGCASLPGAWWPSTERERLACLAVLTGSLGVLVAVLGSTVGG